jgi:hypothetical protein
MVELMVAITLFPGRDQRTLIANVAARNLTRTSRETRAATLAGRRTAGWVPPQRRWRSIRGRRSTSETPG